MEHHGMQKLRMELHGMQNYEKITAAHPHSILKKKGQSILPSADVLPPQSVSQK
jgi:hypothetical protein